MSTIKDLQPQAIWKNFYLLTQVPRPSGHLEKVQEFLLNWAKEKGVEAKKDEAGNILMYKPASAGMENCKMVTLQGHMDMVPQKAKDSAHNFETDPIETYIDGEWVKANGTTLGADDGMAVATIMAIMEDDSIKHGPLEGFITADEETTMYGVNHMNADTLKGEILLNLDNETEGEMVIGSAGGVNQTSTMEYKEADTDADDAAVRVTLHNLLGGHSGLEINEGRGNANKMMARLVQDAIANFEACLSEWKGGNMRNAIPFEAEVVLTLPKENVEALNDMIADWKEELKDEFKGIEDVEKIEFFAENVETPKMEVPQEIQDNLIDAIYACHDGVLRMAPSMPDVVETSSNLAIIAIGEGKASVKILARSSHDGYKEYIATMMESCFSMAGMKVEFSGSYGGWNPNPESNILEHVLKVYKEQNGVDGKVQAVHAGLECSIILGKYPNLDVVSFGPTLLSPHTQNERCQISCVAPFWNLMKQLLTEIPEK